MELGVSCSDLLSTGAMQKDYRTNHLTGLAVSGGVDSMALAALCMQLKKEYTPFAADEYPIHVNQIGFQAVIVNHRARHGSLEEARRVMGVLQSIGMLIIYSYTSMDF